MPAGEQGKASGKGAASGGPVECRGLQVECRGLAEQPSRMQQGTGRRCGDAEPTNRWGCARRWPPGSGSCPRWPAARVAGARGARGGARCGRAAGAGHRLQAVGERCARSGAHCPRTCRMPAGARPELSSCAERMHAHQAAAPSATHLCQVGQVACKQALDDPERVPVVHLNHNTNKGRGQVCDDEHRQGGCAAAAAAAAQHPAQSAGPACVQNVDPNAI